MTASDGFYGAYGADGAYERLCDALGLEPYPEPYHRVLAQHEARAAECRRLAHLALDAAILSGSFRSGRLAVFALRAAHLAVRQLEVVRMRQRRRHRV